MYKIKSFISVGMRIGILNPDYCTNPDCKCGIAYARGVGQVVRRTFLGNILAFVGDGG